MVRLVTLIGAWLAMSGCAGPHGNAGGAAAGGAAGAATTETAGVGGQGPSNVAGAAGDADGAGAPAVPASAELGVPSGPDGLDFMPLVDGDVLELQTFGQGGTHVIVGVRCTGFGSRAFVSAIMHNDDTGVEVAEPPPARPQLLYCDDQGSCDLVPYLVHASGIAPTDAEKDGLHVRLTVKVSTEAGVEAEASRELVLSTANL